MVVLYLLHLSQGALCSVSEAKVLLEDISKTIPLHQHYKFVPAADFLSLIYFLVPSIPNILHDSALNKWATNF
jgi:hypothetical protein